MTTLEANAAAAEQIQQQEAVNYAQQMNDLLRSYVEGHIPASVDELLADNNLAHQATITEVDGKRYAYGPKGEGLNPTAVEQLQFVTSLERYENDPLIPHYDTVIAANSPRDKGLTKQARTLYEHFKATQPQDLPEEGKWGRFKALTEREKSLRDQIADYRKTKPEQAVEAPDEQASVITQTEVSKLSAAERGDFRKGRNAGRSERGTSSRGSGRKRRQTPPGPAKPASQGHRRVTSDVKALEDVVVPATQPQPETKAAGTAVSLGAHNVRTVRRGTRGITPIAPVENSPADPADIAPAAARKPESRPKPKSGAELITEVLEGLQDMPPSSKADLEAIKRAVGIKPQTIVREIRGEIVERKTGNFVDAQGNVVDPDLVAKFEKAMDPESWTLDAAGLAEARRVLLARKPSDLTTNYNHIKDKSGKVVKITKTHANEALSGSILARFRDIPEIQGYSGGSLSEEQRRDIRRLYKQNADIMQDIRSESTRAADELALERAKDYFRARVLMNADVRRDDELTDEQLRDIHRQQMAKHMYSVLPKDKWREYGHDIGMRIYTEGPHKGEPVEAPFALKREEQDEIRAKFGTTQEAFDAFKAGLLVKVARGSLAKNALQAVKDIQKSDKNFSRAERRAERRANAPEQTPVPPVVDERKVAFEAMANMLHTHSEAYKARQAYENFSIMEEIEKARAEMAEAEQSQPMNRRQRAAKVGRKVVDLFSQAGAAQFGLAGTEIQAQNSNVTPISHTRKPGKHRPAKKTRAAA